MVMDTCTKNHTTYYYHCCYHLHRCH